MMGVALVLIGALAAVNGFMAGANAESVMHQIYAALYITGGLLIVGLGAIQMKLTDIKHTLDQAKQDQPKS